MEKNIVVTFDSKSLIAFLLSEKIKFKTFDNQDTVDYIIKDILKMLEEESNKKEICFGFMSENDYNNLLEEYKKRKENKNE